MTEDVAQQERSINNCYTSTFRYIDDNIVTKRSKNANQYSNNGEGKKEKEKHT